MPQIKTTGYIFKAINYNETSQIIRLFSHDLGIISVLVRGALKSDKSNENFDMFSKTSFVLYEPHSGEIYKYKESTLLQSGIDFSKNIKTFYRISLMFKILSGILPERIPATEIYTLLDKTVSKIRKYVLDDSNKLYIFYFLFNLLMIEGYEPNYDHCGQCGDKFHEIAFYSPQKTVLLCKNCNSSPDNIKLNAESIKLMKHITKGVFSKFDRATFTENEKVIWKVLSSSYSANFNLNIDEFSEFIK
ncbi:DNA repair protein RecO [candidate division TA06 bacterium]|uniref:DNA repair protein RecO n=1 Tax=candidate division TA06 bacterium TaxID=2250710 RepID=A0A660SAB4_UNCT6|nr:MAG: DNA repair protein RecO [candidate division TA06 bacterium]